MKKVQIIASILLLMVVTFTGCGKKEVKQEQVDVNVNISEVVKMIETVNPVKEERVIDDFAVENELMLDMTMIEEYEGKITNAQKDCSFIFVAKAKEGKKNDLKEDLLLYKESLVSNDLYVEFADKVAKAKEARIVIYGDYVVMVIAGMDADYGTIDQKIEEAFQ